MLLGGDEFRRTQRGNNNAWCQDNDVSWFDWTYLERHREIYRFTRGMIAFRRAHPVLSEERFYTQTEIQWLGRDGGPPNWYDPKEKALACAIRVSGQVSLLLMFNAGKSPADFAFPPLTQGFRWYLATDTSRSESRDSFTAGEDVDPSQPWALKAHSSAIFVAQSQATRKTEHSADS
jgi:glycogen operon protein